MPLLDPLDDDQRTTFLVISMPRKELLRLVGQLGTAGKGKRLDKLSEWDLAWSLTDYYAEADVAEAVDHALARELGESPLAPAVTAAGSGEALTHLVWEARDPARDLAWAMLGSKAEGAGGVAAQLVARIIGEFDSADEKAKQEEAERVAAAGDGVPEPAVDPERQAREREHKAERDRQARERERKRLEETKDRLAEVEQALATARRDLRAAEDGRERGEAERRRLADERDAVRTELKQGTAGEVARLRDELETVTRRMRALQRDADEAREAEEGLAVRIRQLEAAPTLRTAGDAASDDDRPAGSGPGWCTPIFTDEFYESIRRWDRKVVRNAFDKVHRLAEDWRHPSLRAIPLEGLPDCFRIRIATDVRLIYRPLDGNRLEIMALIDREDLQRYIRQAKTR